MSRTSTGDNLPPGAGAGAYRYLDAMTVRPSEAASRPRTGMHATLLVEPIVMPNIGYIDVGKNKLSPGKSMFYPNEHKGANLEKSLTNKLNECSIAPHRPPVGTKKKKTKVDLVPDVTERRKARAPQSRKPDDEVKNMISSLRDMESKLDFATGIRT
jgi:hypothetical protein